MNKKRLMIFATVMMTIGAIFPAHAAQYVTISDIREETKDGWHETYEAHGRTITVDSEIHVPTVDKTPVVRAGTYSFADFVPPEDVLDFSWADGRDSGFVLSYWQLPYLETYNPEDFARCLVMEGSQAEDNLMTPEAAESFAFEVLRGLEKEPLDYESYAIVPFSRWYVDEGGVDGDFTTLNRDRPVTLMGNYSVNMHQLIQGIPIIETGAVLGGANYKTRAYTGMTIDVFSKENYGVSYFPIKEKEIMLEDLPLLPYAQIQKTFETYIKKGVVRDVYRIDFGYMMFDDEQNQEYILKPIWAMYCDIMWDATKPTLWMDPVLAGDRKLTGGRGSGIGVFVDAQTGEAYVKFETPESKSSLPTGRVLTWDEVK